MDTLATLWGLTGAAAGLGLALVVGLILLPRLSARARAQGRSDAEPERQRLLAELDAARRESALAAQRGERFETEAAELRGRLDLLSDERAGLAARVERLPTLEALLQRREQELAAERQAREAQDVRVAALDSSLREQQRAHDEKLTLLSAAETRLGDSFRALAQQILEERAQRFGEQSQQQIGGLVEPLRQQIKEFREAVAATQAAEQRERGALVNEIQSLKQLNQRIGEDALNLTRALRGDSQAQGAWGEMVLERVLESSGLQSGREFETQASFDDGEGGRARPDAVVHLPDDKDLVIDAKVSLLAYERYCTDTDEGARALALREHLGSLRRHIDGLSGRAYSELPGLRTLDFVLMFVPIEAAFIDAVRADPDLYQYALRANVSLVSPSTLLATLRTVAHLWRIEQRNVNATEIARRAANLHDNFVALVGELETVGSLLDRARQAQAGALRRIVEGGKGSVILQVRSLAELGAPAKKRLPAALVQAASGESDPTETDTPADAPGEDEAEA